MSQIGALALSPPENWALVIIIARKRLRANVARLVNHAAICLGLTYLLRMAIMATFSFVDLASLELQFVIGLGKLSRTDRLLGWDNDRHDDA
jgi:hypothetical protein